MSEEKKENVYQKLRTKDQVNEAIEWIFNSQRTSKIDSKTADGMNTTIKNAVYLNFKLPMDAAKLWFSARVKKIDIPEGLLPQ